MKTIAVLLACYNRRETTLRCLTSLFAQRLPHEVRLEVYLTDDGSTDGTAAAVAERFPQVHVIGGSGQLYWTGGMARSWSEAIPSDFYLWLNDDLVLHPGALLALWNTYEFAADPRSICVGCVRNLATGEIEYGGKRIGSRLIFRFDTVAPADRAERGTTFNGNFVLIPESARRVIGALDASLEHYLADYDYGLRATSAGIPIWVAPGCHGDSERSSYAGSFRDPSLSRRRRWSAILQPKGMPPRAYWQFIAKHAPWPKVIYWIAPYVKILFGVAGRSS